MTERLQSPSAVGKTSASTKVGMVQTITVVFFSILVLSTLKEHRLLLGFLPSERGSATVGGSGVVTKSAHKYGETAQAIQSKYDVFAEIGRLGWQVSALEAKSRVIARREVSGDDFSLPVDYKDIVTLTLERFDAVVRAGIGPALLEERERGLFDSPDAYNLASLTPFPPLEDFPRLLKEKMVFTAEECIASADTCGESCGVSAMSPEICWCVRIAFSEIKKQWSITYHPKKSHEMPELMSWHTEGFVMLQSNLNVIQIALDRMGTNRMIPTPVYLVVNVFPRPRNFIPYFDPPFSNRSYLPQVTPLGYPPSDSTVGQGEVQFATPFHWREGLGMHFALSPCIRPPYMDECCNVGRGLWDFEEKYPFINTGSDKKLEYRNLDYVPFPIFSHSITPQYNFDLLMPSRHFANSYGRLLEGIRGTEESDAQENWFQESIHFTRIPHVPWAEKSKRIAFRADDLRCYGQASGDHRSRFCVQLKEKHESTYQELWNMEDLSVGGVVPLRELAQSKFIVLVDYMTEHLKTAETRNIWVYTLGSVVLCSGFHLDVRLALLKPYIHYIPFTLDDPMSFWSALELVAADDEYAQWVAGNMRRAAFTIFSGARLNEVGTISPSESKSDLKEEEEVASENDDVQGHTFDGGHNFDVLYWMELLKQYSERYTFQDNDSNVELNFTSDRGCESFVAAKERLKASREGRTEYFDGWSSDFACESSESVDPVTKRKNSRFVQHYVHPWLASDWNPRNDGNNDGGVG